MGDKKGKALALDLMEGLLNEDGDDLEIIGVPPLKKSEVKATAEKISAADNHDRLLADHEIAISGATADDSGATARDPSGTVGDPTGTAVVGATEISEPRHDVAPGGGDEDRTMRIHPSNIPQPASSPPAAQNVPSSAAQGGGRVRASVGRFGAFRSGGQASTTEAALAQSESLRIAQSRLLEFEQEIERLRLQNEELAAAGETLRRRTDELITANQKRDSDYKNAVSTFTQEKAILNGSKDALQRELEGLRQKYEELELRISTNIQKIRVRERELENRLELVKMESAALIRNKDEMILELKRNIDQLNLELNNYRTKNQELNRVGNDKQEQLRRTVKALRLALSMLEGEEEAPKNAAAPPVRKAK